MSILGNAEAGKSCWSVELAGQVVQAYAVDSSSAIQMVKAHLGQPSSDTSKAKVELVDFKAEVEEVPAPPSDPAPLSDPATPSDPPAE